MSLLARLLTTAKAVRQLGLPRVALFGIYRLGLASGHYKRSEPEPEGNIPAADLVPVFPLPDRQLLLETLGPEGKSTLLAEADEIAAGLVRLFGAAPTELRLDCEGPLRHWTAYESDPGLLAALHGLPADIKLTWEPVRFGWAFALGRAYHLSGDERYPAAFWRGFETFADANPPFLGPHWMSGQEAALRLMAFAWAAQVLAASPHSTPERMSRLATAVASHAARIPPTLVYARSQHNNHLLTEAAGLLTAGLALPGHCAARRWRSLGWKWLTTGLSQQIDGYGEYAQHSTNYHRLMLQVALWIGALLPGHALHWPRPTVEALGRATHWLLGLLDPVSGQVPNLGANDGAYIFPLSTCAFADFRPVTHAAAQAFLHYHLPTGAWDELALWSGLSPDDPKLLELERYPGDNLAAHDSWGTLRAIRLASRPSHADQLHFDLWWRGLNLARDPGTYRYNAPAPWDNALTSTLVHNTVSVDGREQMTRAGRFLYLDWIDAYYQVVIDPDEQILQHARAHHYAYWRQGLKHTRTVLVTSDVCWRVEDELSFLPWLPWRRRPRVLRLHWLLPDWEWEADRTGNRLVVSLRSPHGPLGLTIFGPGDGLQVRLARAGERVYGQGEAAPIDGWYAPTYGIKEPALSLAVTFTARDNAKFISEFRFPK
ncbi:MAG: alginate lyase family protein [Anaerolineales bacterium]|nr:alginate lyase family protein [Anaerolineales bacterium]